MAKKRSNGEGTMRHRPDGRWESVIMIGYQDNGKPKCKYFYAKTRKELQDKVMLWKRDRLDGIKADTPMRFNDWAGRWFRMHRKNISETTAEGYRYTLRILLRYFGDCLLSDIKVIHIEQFLQQMRSEGRADSSIAKFRGMLYQILDRAEANDLIRKNPVRFAQKHRSVMPPRRKDAFTAEEVRILMRELPYDRTGNSIRLLLGTGMRSQELLALEPKHIAEDGTYIYIRQAVKMIKGTAIIGPPKSRDSYRDIPIPEGLQACARFLRQTERRYIWEEGRPDSPCNPSYFRKCFQLALEAIPQVRTLTPHSCRHTYVSQMQSLGVDLQTIQSIVGHAEIDMTEYYLHLQEPTRLAAIAKFSDAFLENP